MIDMMTIAQAFGIASFIIGIYTFTHKNDKKLKISMTCLHTCQVIHFYLLDATNAVISNIISAIRSYLSINFNAKWLGWFFIVLNIAMGAPVVEQWVDILPMCGAVIGTYAVFYSQGIQMRVLLVIGALCWLINNTLVGSIGGVLLETLAIGANLLTIYRLYLDKKDETTQTEGTSQ